MTSCEEANLYLKQCGLTRLDGDNDGVPWREDLSVTEMQDKLNVDIHTILGLISGLRKSGGNEKLLTLFVEQLQVLQDELNTPDIEDARQSPEESQQWIAKTKKLIAEIDAAPPNAKLDWVRKMLEEKVSS